MKIDGLDQRPVNVEDYCFNHNSVFISLRQSFLPCCLGGETLCLADCPLGVEKDCLPIFHSAVMIAPTAALRSEPISPLIWFCHIPLCQTLKHLISIGVRLVLKAMPLADPSLAVRDHLADN